MIQEISVLLEREFNARLKICKAYTPKNLPLLYGWLFEYHRAEIEGQNCVLACRRDDSERLSPARIGKMFRHMQTLFDAPLVYVGRQAVGHDAERLVCARVPFIFPKKHVYLPFMWTKLTLTAAEEPVQTEWLSACAQLMILGALEHVLPYEQGYATVQETLGYTRPVINEAMRQLEAVGLGMRVSSGRTRIFRFARRGRELWNMAQLNLRTPCRRTVGVATLPAAELFPAAEDALAPLSELAEYDTITNYATYCPEAKVRGWQRLQDCDAPYHVQLWHYPPSILGGDRIDPLSLVLSLRHSSEPRVQQAIEYVINQYPW